MDHCELCGLQLISNLQLAYHNVSASHLKKLKTHLEQVGLGGYCFACNEMLSNSKVANAHLLRQEHKQRATEKKNTFGQSNAKFVCDPCCLEFSELVGCEVHLATCAHKKEGITMSFPRLNLLLRQLSGSSLDAIGPKFEPLCSLCKKSFESFDEFLIHLLTSTHIQFLLMSSCYVCEKSFPHLSDLEKHLFTPKHQSNLQFYKKYLKKRNGDIIKLKQGYSCQPCLIWCMSWQCFSVHLLDNRHHFFASTSENISELNGKSHPELFPECNMDWRRWKEQPINLSAWCYHCSKVLLNPEETEIHLTESCSPKSAHVQRFVGRISTSNLETSGISVCGPCFVGFKSSLSQLVHEAFQQHSVHTTALRQSMALELTLGSFEKIGVDHQNVSEKGFDIVKVERPLFQNAEHFTENFLEGGSPIPYNGQTRSLDLDASENSIFRACGNSKCDSDCIKLEVTCSQQKSLDSDDLLILSGSKPESSSKGKILQTKESCLQKDLSSYNGGFDVLDGIKAQQLFSFRQFNHGCLSDPSIEKCSGFPLKSSISSVKPAGSRVLTSVSSLDNFVADSTLREKDGNAKTGSQDAGHYGAVKPEVMAAPSLPTGSHHDKADPLTDGMQEHIVDNSLDCSEILNGNLLEGRHDVCTFQNCRDTPAACRAENDHSQSHTSAEESTLVAAAVLSPCQSLETSLQSVMNVVLSTLTASAATISNSASISPEVKRQRSSDFLEGNNKRSKVDVLRDAVIQALSSWCPNAVDNAMILNLGEKTASTNYDSIDNSRDGPSCAITSGQSDGLSMVVAAAVFNPSSDAREAQHCENGHAATNQICSLKSPGRIFQGENSRQDSNPAQRQHVVGPVHNNKASPLILVPHHFSHHLETNHSLLSSPEAKLCPTSARDFDSEDEDESDSLGALQAQYFSELDRA